MPHLWLVGEVSTLKKTEVYQKCIKTDKDALILIFLTNFKFSFVFSQSKYVIGFNFIYFCALMGYIIGTMNNNNLLDISTAVYFKFL